jgi:pimeloyl-ACP methyl ester carboxylesterase
MTQSLVLKGMRLGFTTLGHLAPEASGRVARRLFMHPRHHRRPEREEALLRTARPVKLPEGLRAWAWGAGPTVLLVHGWEGRGAQLGAFVQPLVAAGHTVVALDGPAHGESSGEETHPLAFAEALLAVGRHLGPLAGVVAHSFGASSTVIALSRGLDAARVVLVAGPSSLTRVLHRFGAFLSLPDTARDAFIRQVEERVGVPADDIHPALLAPSLRQPALLVHDVEDVVVPFLDSDEMVRAWPGARLLETRGLGHRRILRDPDVVARATEFLCARRAVLAAVG